jgi:hypothetical protein
MVMYKQIIIAQNVMTTEDRVFDSVHLSQKCNCYNTSDGYNALTLAQNSSTPVCTSRNFQDDFSSKDDPVYRVFIYDCRDSPRTDGHTTGNKAVGGYRNRCIGVTVLYQHSFIVLRFPMQRFQRPPTALFPVVCSSVVSLCRVPCIKYAYHTNVSFKNKVRSLYAYLSGDNRWLYFTFSLLTASLSNTTVCCH